MPLLIWFAAASLLLTDASFRFQPVYAAPAESYIAQLARLLEAGEFKHFEPVTPPSEPSFRELLRGQRPDGSSAPAIDTWTDSAQWDPTRQRAFFLGLRQSNRFLTYHATTNTWHEIDLDVAGAPPKYQRFGHLYGRTALDWKRGHFYRLNGNTLHRYMIDSGHWERFEDIPIQGYIPIDWNAKLDMIVGVADRQVYGFREGEWHSLGASAVDGYHSSAKYNPVRGDMLFIGGNHSRNKVALLTRNGQVREMRDAPFAFGISQDNLTHDPVSGNYLVLHRDRVLWEYSPDVDEWRIALDASRSEESWPFPRHGGIVPIVVDELGVILWNHASSARLHRHASVFATPTRTNSRPPASTAIITQPNAPPPQTTAPSPQRLEQPTRRSHHAGKSLIEAQAQTMQPGEWRDLSELTTWPGKDEGVSFKTFQYVRALDGGTGGADGMGWTQNLVYHHGKLMVLLMRDRFERALLVMEADGRFWRINQPEGFDQNSHRRPFNKLTQDDTYLYYSPNIRGLGRMIRTPLETPGVFEDFGIPIEDSQIAGQFAATYVPEWNRFYAYTPGGKIWSWAKGEAHWTRHADMPRDEQGHRLSGYAGLLLWNPVFQELVIVGGQTFGNSESTSHKVYRLTSPLGAPEMLRDRRYPDGRLMPWGSGTSKLMVDPRDGAYLHLHRNGTLYRSCEPGGTLRVYEDLSQSQPFGRYEFYTPLTNVPDTDVIVFLSHIRGLVLHRLQPLPSPPCTQTAVRTPSPETPTDTSPEPPPAAHPSQPGQQSTTDTPPRPPLSGNEARTRSETPKREKELTPSVIREARLDQQVTRDAPQPPMNEAHSPAEYARQLEPATIRALR